MLQASGSLLRRLLGWLLAVIGEVSRLGLYGGMEDSMEQVDFSPDPMEGTQILYTNDWFGVSRATGGGLCRSGASHDLVGQGSRSGNTEGVIGGWFSGLVYWSREVS